MKASLKNIFKIFKVAFVVFFIFSIIELGSSIYSLVIALTNDVESTILKELMEAFKITDLTEFKISMITSIINSIALIAYSVLNFIQIKKILNEDNSYSINVCRHIKYSMIFSMIPAVVIFIGTWIVQKITGVEVSNGYVLYLITIVIYALINVIIKDVINNYQLKEVENNEEQN